MGFEAYLPRGFDHRHENEAFELLVKELEKVFGTLPGRHVLIGNVMFSGNEMDAVLFKPDGIAIVEMKDHGGKVEFSENTAWRAGGREVKGGTKANPFVQVRSYRIALRTWLEQLEQQMELHPRPPGGWREISAVVLFARDIQFDDQVLFGALRYWFQVTDLAHAAERLGRIQARSLRFEAGEIDSILRQLGIRGEHRYGSQPMAPGTPLEVTPAPATTAIQLDYVKEFNFRDHELRMRNLGGARSQGAQQVRQWFEQVRQGLNPFATAAKRTDPRVRGATIYSLNAASELLLIELGVFAIPAFLGEPQDVEGWLEAHKDLTVSLDEASGRVSITRVSSGGERARLDAPALTAENTPFLLRVPGIVIEELVSQALARDHLLALDETSTETEINQALELVFNEDVRAFLFDVISLIRGGNTAGAEARIRLRNGEALPAEDAGAFAQEAAASGTNSDQVLVINELSKEELDRLLDPVNFQEWMLFLHPDQQALVEAEFEKPVVLKGISGSGKTCILVHRARHLARKYPGERIGVLTLSKPLAGLLQNLVNQLCTEQERENIEVLPFYDVFARCLRELGPEKYFTQLESQFEARSHMHTVLAQAGERWPTNMVWDLDPVNKAKVEEEWNEFYMQRNPDVNDWMRSLVKHLESLSVDASRYVEEEFMLIRSAFTVPDRREKYLTFEREGRTIPFRSELRKDALRLLLFWEEWLLAGGMIDALGLTQALMPLHAEMQKLPEHLRFRCLLVDEYQDFSSLDLQLLRRVVPLDKPNALFVAGDPVQKILVKRLRYLDAALDEGTATHRKIWKNYRNSKQILRAASKVANHFGKVAGSQGEEIEVLDPELAQRETNPPIAIATTNQIEKAWEVTIECMQNDRAEPWTVCIATASPQKVSVEAILALRPAAVKATALSGNCILHPDEVVVGTIADLKGFEFRLVIIVGCDAEALPYRGIPRDEIWREALRLYVAMTRARDQLFLIYEGEPSQFLTVMEDTVICREELTIKAYDKVVSTNGDGEAATNGLPDLAAQILANKAQGLDADGRCEGWFSKMELDTLHKYFARHVYRDGLTFRDWLRPDAMRAINAATFYRVPRCVPTLVSAVIGKLKDHGIIVTTQEPRLRERRNGKS